MLTIAEVTASRACSCSGLRAPRRFLALSISERRIEKLVNPALSDLPAFLVKEGGLNSGLMMAQVTAAALVSECKVLAHPASVDSIPTSAAKEDHVSMSPIAARKLASIVENLERVLAIELIAAFQAMEFLKPLRSSAPIERVRTLRDGAGRTGPFTFGAIMRSLFLGDAGDWDLGKATLNADADRVKREVADYESMGVDQVQIRFRSRSCEEYVEQIERFAAEIM